MAAPAIDLFFGEIPSLLADEDSGSLLERAHGLGFSDDELRFHRFVDATGHAWSLLSWVGYQYAQAFKNQNVRPLQETLGLYRSDPRVRQGLGFQTQPGEPDLLWGWLGHYSITHKPSNDSFFQALSPLFSWIKEPPLGVDQGRAHGWVLKALALLSNTLKDGNGSDAFQTIGSSLITQLVCAPRIASVNVAAHRQLGNLIPKGERIPGIGPCVHDPDVLLAAAAPILRAQVELFKNAHQQLGGSSLLLYAFMIAEPSVELWSTFFKDFRDSEWDAMKAVVDEGFLPSPTAFRSTSVSAWALMLMCGKRLSPEQEKRIHHQVCEVPLDFSHGPPTLYDFHNWKAIPPLVEWKRTLLLDIGLPAAAPSSPRPRF